MQDQFEKFCENIKLTPAQREDARVKYSGVCKKIHDYFFETEYSGSTKLIFGSYSKAKNTAIRPISEDQDVDVLFKIPDEIFKRYLEYKTGGQSALLQKIRDILLESKYALGEKPKAWGKVILVKTADGKHNIELLPAYEKENGIFIIPNSENGGTWDFFDPRTELERFRKSNEQTNGLTGDLSRMIKRWAREVHSLTIKSFEIENFVIDFLAFYDYNNKSYSKIATDFFEHFYIVVNQENKSYVETAKNRSNKAYNFEQEKKIDEATVEWKKIFGDSSFPVYSEKEFNLKEIIEKLKEEYPTTSEEYLESKYGINFAINPDYLLKVDVSINQNGWRSNYWLLVNFHKCGYRILKKAKLKFKIIKNTVPLPYEVKWKVRNFGDEAKELNALRGEITDDLGFEEKKENTLYRGEHYVECYIIKNDQCVAVANVFIPIE